MFSRYRIYHFEDFMCVLPVSIVNGKTHQKSPAHSSVFRGFFCKMCLADFQDWLFHKLPIYLESHRVCPLVRIGTPDPLSHKRVWGRGGRSIFMVGVPVEGTHTWEPRFCDGCTRWGDSDLKTQVLWPVYQLRELRLKKHKFCDGCTMQLAGTQKHKFLWWVYPFFFKEMKFKSPGFCGWCSI